MDDVTAAMIDLAESRRGLAVALLDGYVAGAHGQRGEARFRKD
jgi:hypothetical protein